MLVTVLFTPWWLNVVEASAARILGVEEALRWYFAVFMALFLAGSAFFTVRTKGGLHMWLALAAMCIVLLPIFVFDGTELYLEESWIRYPTAGALAFSAVAVFFLFVDALRARSTRGYSDAIVWGTVACGTLFLATDELLQIHENLSDWLATMFPGFENDWITILYVGIGLAATLVFSWFSRRTLSATHAWIFRGYLGAVAVFAVSQVCDSYDHVLFDYLRSVASRLAEQGHPFPDIWFVLHRPRQLTNDLEEVLECTAAVMILAVTLRAAVMGRSTKGTPDVAIGAPPSLKAGLGRRHVAQAAWGIVAFSLAILGWPAATASDPFVVSSPLLERQGAVRTRLATHQDLIAARKTLRFAAEGTLKIDRRRRELIFRARGTKERPRLRRMLKDVRGVALEMTGEIRLLTRTDRGRSFLPMLAWSTGHIAHDAIMSKDGSDSANRSELENLIAAYEAPAQLSY